MLLEVCLGNCEIFNEEIHNFLFFKLERLE